MMNNFLVWLFVSILLFSGQRKEVDHEQEKNVSIDSVLVQLEKLHDELNGQNPSEVYADSVTYYEMKLVTSKQACYEFEVNCPCDYMKSDTCIETLSDVQFIDMCDKVFSLHSKFNDCKSNVNRIQRDSSIILNEIEALREYNRSLWGSCDELVEFEYRGCSYKAFIYSVDSMELGMHLLSTDSPHSRSNTIANLYDKLNTKGEDVLMLTNAGMYTSVNMPQGLFIKDSIIIEKLDLGGDRPLNFYMLPNGVFFQRNDSLFVDETKAFASYFNNNKSNNISCATQSGPLLVHDGEIHHRFMHASKNFHLRSGVGILSPEKAVFIISREPKTRFYDFAVIFRDFFGCDNALYLDGAISEMYFIDDSLSEFGNKFGPMISITKKRNE